MTYMRLFSVRKCLVLKRNLSTLNSNKVLTPQGVKGQVDLETAAKKAVKAASPFNELLVLSEQDFVIFGDIKLTLDIVPFDQLNR